MVEINGVVYLIVGLIVTGGSIVVNLQNQNYKFMLFLLAGVFMIILGIIKLTGSKKAQKKPVVQGQHQHINAQFVKYCSKCGNALQGFQQFCHLCGGRLFHRR
jgi:sulfite exporter TauE/SafE